jgi:hypothetical protein
VVLLPESFRGGCSFGTGISVPASPNKVAAIIRGWQALASKMSRPHKFLSRLWNSDGGSGKRAFAFGGEIG